MSSAGVVCGEVFSGRLAHDLLNTIIGAEAAEHDEEPLPLTVSDLTGQDRYLTTVIATWIRQLNLDDGSRALGIQYRSKHGLDLMAYGIWLRATDDGRPDREPTTLRTTEPITANNPDLTRAAAIHGMTVIP